MDDNKIWQMAPSVQEQYVKDQTAIKRISQESGLLAKIWGTKHSASNIAGVVCFVSLGCLIYAVCGEFKEKDVQERILQIAISLISLSLGYIFGNYKKNEK